VIVSAHDGYPRWLSSGADYIEVDVRRRRDGVIVLSHDELRPGDAPIRFEEVVDRACGLQLDLKEAGFELELMRAALARCPARNLAVTTDLKQSLRIIKREFPEVRTGLTARHVEDFGADFFALDHTHVAESDLRAGREVWLWTVDDSRMIERYIQDERIAGIITNRPDLVLSLRSAG
jgi:glycerophosphoryl diester phosphodiesterase